VAEQNKDHGNRYGGGAMKERPILFSGPMVRAIMEGRKTQTRRIVKGCFPPITGPDHWNDFTDQAHVFKCPYGKPGDQLWVREAWAWGTGPADGQEPTKDNTAIIYREDWERTYPKGSDYDLSGSWKPSIHMPRWASRIQLEVTGVRVERLQDISEEDAWAEGVPCSAWQEWDWDDDGYPTPWGKRYQRAKEEYEELWESINGLGSWASDPFVWVIEFKAVGR